MASEWISYNDLAWTEDWLADPSDCEEEAAMYVELLQRGAFEAPRTLLHLGSGSGGFDTVFAQHFEVTGVDLSVGMLAKARAAHPDIEYLEGDMRMLRLGREFDAVVIPDGIDYMVSLDDLRSTIRTAVAHLRPGGVLLVVAKPAEGFQDNNFAYVGDKRGVHVTLFENNYADPHRPGTYEATLVYLIREQGELAVHVDRHVLGLFPLTVWHDVFTDAGLELDQTDIDGVYDRYLLGEGAYPMTAFLGRKR